MYLKHAKAHDKIKENGTMIALMNDQCKIIVGNPYVVKPKVSQGDDNGPSQRMGNAPANQVMNTFQCGKGGSSNMPMNSLSFN
jgi:hypothetical protein